MNNTPPGPLILEILRLLEEVGPMTSAELARAMNHCRKAVAAVVCRLQKPCSTRPRMIHIASYTYDDEVHRRVPRRRAVFALGDKRDATMPRRPAAQRSKDYRERKKVRVNSVFSLALTVNQRIEGKQWTPSHERNQHGNEETQARAD